MYYNDESVVVSYDQDIAIPSIDPTKIIADIKDHVTKKLPIRWSRHDLFYRDIKLDDRQTIYSVGISSGDVVEIIAVPHRSSSMPTLNVR